MKTLNLHRIWEILNLLSDKQDELSEQGIYVYLLGNMSSYVESDFEHFLKYYSFKVEKDYISIFNDETIPWEDYTNNDFNVIPFDILGKSDDEINTWAGKEVKKQLEQQEKERLDRKENLRLEIERLNREYNNLPN